MKHNKLFGNVVNNSDLLDVVVNNSDKVGAAISDDMVPNYLYSLHSLINKNDDRLTKYAQVVDENFPLSNIRTHNAMHKIPVLLTGCIFLDKYRMDVDNLTDDELGVLSNISRFDDIDNYASNIKMYSKDILAAVYNKSRDFMVQLDLLCLIEDKFFEFDIKEDDMDLTDFQEKMVNYIKTMSDEEYLESIKNYDEKIEEEMNGMGF